tara:strand:- start:219 stop:557 length:339 start_codon:yes stop_codon:yes gene_type:complete
MIVNDGKDNLAELIRLNYTRVRIGDGSDGTAASQEKLDHEVGTVKTNITPTRVNNLLTWNVTYTGGELPPSGATELGIFDGNDVMLTRVTFKSTGPVAASDSVTFTVKLEVA